MTTAKQMEILFICGSPRSHTSEALLALLEQGARNAGARSRRFLLSKKHIAPCKGCGYCETTGNCIMVDKRAETNSSDDYVELLDALEHADALAVVSPLFFAGPPAQLKALFDRFQPFWARKYLLDQKPVAKRPAQIFIVGGGGDNHGYEPLVNITKSALAVAGFSLEKTQNFIGFKRASDVALLPSEEEASNMAFGELAHLRKAAALQREFEQRALAAGSAFARFVRQAMVKQNLQAELKQVEEEMAELVAEEPHPALLFRDYEEESPRGIVDQLDSGFEALKKTARASKASGSEKAVAEAKVSYLGEEEALDNENTDSPDGPSSEEGANGILDISASEDS